MTTTSHWSLLHPRGTCSGLRPSLGRDHTIGAHGDASFLQTPWRKHRRDAEQVAGRRPPCGHSGRHADSTPTEVMDAALGHAPSTSTLVGFAQTMARDVAAG